MHIKLSPEMIEYYNSQLEYARIHAERAKAMYNEWNNMAYMEDSPALSISYSARAGLAHDEFLFWTSVVSSLKCKLRVI